MPSPKIDSLLAFAVLLRDGAQCVYCDARQTDGAHITVDHLTPRAWGGKDVENNLVACCSACNTLKGTMDHHAFADMLLRFCRVSPEIRRRFGITGPGIILPRIVAQIAIPLDFARAAQILNEHRQAQRKARRS